MMKENQLKIKMNNTYKYLIITLLVIFAAGCSDDPTPIVIGKDNCDYCKMMITDFKYASELVTSKGKTFKFDSIECLAAYNKLNPNDAGALWVPIFNKNKVFIKVENAYFLLSPNLKSPMSLNISAYSNISDLNSIKNKYDGKQLTWKEVSDYVKEKWAL